MTIDRDALGAEREFLLRSLDDLEAERADGNIDDDTYRVLHDDYTARAAATIRTLADGVDHRPADPPPRSAARRLLTISGIVAFVVVASLLLALAIGDRRPGQTASGNDQPASATTNPKSYAAHVAKAGAALRANDLKSALVEYTEASRVDPKQPEPPTYIGWISALVARQVAGEAERTTLLATATSQLARATKLDPEYPDAYFFTGYVLFELENKPARAVPAFQRFLLLAPADHPMREQVLAELARAEQAVPKP
jgi:tetratricopeptide (TPR) repeat protein